MKIQHDGDCTIYSPLINGRPESGICTCGYGWEKIREGSDAEMYSKELRNEMNTKHPVLVKLLAARLK